MAKCALQGILWHSEVAMARKTLRKTAFRHKPEIRIRGRQALEGLLEGVGCECEGISPRIQTSPLLQVLVEGVLRECECRVLAFQLIFDAQYGNIGTSVHTVKHFSRILPFIAAQYEKMRRRFILCETEPPGRGRSWRKKLKKLSPARQGALPMGSLLPV